MSKHDVHMSNPLVPTDRHAQTWCTHPTHLSHLTHAQTWWCTHPTHLSHTSDMHKHGDVHMSYPPVPFDTHAQTWWCRHGRRPMHAGVAWPEKIGWRRAVKKQQPTPAAGRSRQDLPEVCAAAPVFAAHHSGGAGPASSPGALVTASETNRQYNNKNLRLPVTLLYINVEDIRSRNLFIVTALCCITHYH